MVARGGQDFVQERIFFVFDQVLVIDRHRRTQAGVGIGLHQRIDRVLRRVGIVECVVMHRCDAGFEHLDRAQHGLQIDDARVGLGHAVRRHLEQHE